MKYNIPTSQTEYEVRIKYWVESSPPHSKFTRQQIYEMADLYQFKTGVDYHETSCGSCIRRMTKLINQEYIRLSQRKVFP